jgi:gluconolactonase
MRTIVLLLCTLAVLRAEDYALGPDSQPHAGVPKGGVTKYVLNPGKFYPGTPHDYSVYVPAQYKASKPAPFMIFLDGNGFAGNGFRVPVVLDNLIAKGDLPAMIGIFISPGVLPVLSGQAQNRFNRIFEYDNLSGRYAQFLSEELIPEVAKKYNLSRDPNDRGIGGSSTGAVGALVAAWNRPDQFRRVFTFIGTFVDMKGADRLPAMIRKTEPKPIRIFMQDGRKDHIIPEEPWGTFYAGSWPINNQVMYEAFESAGYDAKYVLGDEGHNGKHGSAIMPEVLRWLWRDYPKPIVVHEPAAMTQPGWDPRGKVYSMVSADKGWEQVGAEFKSLESPTAGKDGVVYFAGGDRIYQSDAAGKVTVFKEHTGGARSIAFGPDGRVYASQLSGKRIVSYSPGGSLGAGGDEKAVATNCEAGRLVVTAKGAIYYTDAAHKSIGRIDANGRKSVAYGGGEILQPSGLALSPDQSMLNVTDSQSRFSWSLQIAADGSLQNGEPFYRLEMPETAWRSDVSGVTVDAIGQVYFATPLGIQMAEANGRVAAILNPPALDPVTDVIFAGKNMDWLYITAGGKIFRRPVKQPGVATWSPIKPPKPPL